MPEEHNRRLTDHLSRLLFAHSQSAVDNLEREGIEPADIHLVGNTMIDSLRSHVEEARSLRPWRRFAVDEGGYGLVTLHRPSLVDDGRLLERTAEALIALAREVPLVFPVHPRTLRGLEEARLDERLRDAGIRVVEPLGYFEFVGLEAGAMFVVTDSGGVQEETSALGTRCFTLRNTTERPVTVDDGTNTLLGLEPQQLLAIPQLLREPKPGREIPLWDGHAGERIAALLCDFLTLEDVATFTRVT
jgi:UDP-N-acetylglucosamine 2-epimerase (non-hydrolysing)